LVLSSQEVVSASKHVDKRDRHLLVRAGRPSSRSDPLDVMQVLGGADTPGHPILAQQDRRAIRMAKTAEQTPLLMELALSILCLETTI
jgi:hypothetical protein